MSLQVAAIEMWERMGDRGGRVSGDRRGTCGIIPQSLPAIVQHEQERHSHEHTEYCADLW